jgi:hypothetical protein
MCPLFQVVSVRARQWWYGNVGCILGIVDDLLKFHGSLPSILQPDTHDLLEPWYSSMIIFVTTPLVTNLALIQKL